MIAYSCSSLSLQERAGGEAAEQRLKRLLRNDPGMGVIRHADAGYDIAKETLKENDLDFKERLKA